MNEALRQLDAFTTPGTLLKAAREARGMTARDAADQLHLMPDYVNILERDDYDALRSPAFARGYVKAYSKLLGLDEAEMLQLFDQIQEQGQGVAKKRIETKPLQLQRTGLGVVVGLCVLLLLTVALWWWRGDGGETPPQQVNAEADYLSEYPGQKTAGGEGE